MKITAKEHYRRYGKEFTEKALLNVLDAPEMEENQWFEVAIDDDGITFATAIVTHKEHIAYVDENLLLENFDLEVPDKIKVEIEYNTTKKHPEVDKIYFYYKKESEEMYNSYHMYLKGLRKIMQEIVFSRNFLNRRKFENNLKSEIVRMRKRMGQFLIASHENVKLGKVLLSKIEMVFEIRKA